MTDHAPAAAGEGKPGPEPGTRRSRRRGKARGALRRRGARSAPRWPVVLAAVVVPLGAALGLALRAWLLRHDPLTSDQAVVGLMARAVLHGHVTTFFWGQPYGGAEPYVVAPVLWLAHGSPTGIGATAAVLSGVAAALVGVAVAWVTGSRWLAALAAAGAWVWPYAVVWNSAQETGFRGVCVACGLAALCCAVRIHRGHRGLGTCVVLGLAAGVGWWSSPEIVYLAVPVLVLLVASWDRLYAGGARWARPWRPLPAAVAVGGAAVGALPWIATNARTGFASLRAGSLPEYHGIGYAGRLGVFFRAMLPVQLGVRAVPGGAWVGGPTVGAVLYGVALAVVVAALLRAGLAARRGRVSAPLVGVAAGVVAFPFVYALVPSTGYWSDGRYGVALPGLLVMAFAFALAPPPPATAATPAAAGPAPPPADTVPAPPAAGAVVVPTGRPTARARHARRGHAPVTVAGRAVAVACAGLVAMGVLTACTARTAGIPTAPAAFAAGWGDPEAPVRHVLAAMHRHHLRYAYGDYWTAYVLDFLDPTGVVVSPSHLDVVRWPEAAAAVRAAPRPAWLFFAPGHLHRAAEAFANPETGPGNYTQQQFTGLLEARGVPFTVVHLGVLDAVVPARRVTLPKP